MIGQPVILTSDLKRQGAIEELEECIAVVARADVGSVLERELRERLLLALCARRERLSRR